MSTSQIIVTKGSAPDLLAKWDKWNREQYEPQTPPKGAISAEQLAERAGITRAAANGRLKRGVEIGELKTRTFRVRCGNGSVRTVRYYWQK